MARTILICVSYLLIALTGMTLIKSGYEAEPIFTIPVIGTGISIKTLIGIMMYGISFLIYVLFVSKLKISIVMPVLSGLNCVLTAMVGIMLFKEHVSHGQIAGIALIVIGTMLVGVLEKTGQ